MSNSVILFAKGKEHKLTEKEKKRYKAFLVEIIFKQTLVRHFLQLGQQCATDINH